MLIVMRCLSCGHVLADLWNYYEKECKKLDEQEGDQEQQKDLKNMNVKTRGKILDDLGLKRMCCRRCMLGCVDMMDRI
jgi:DNA-directed RNA polymerase subunit N